MTTTTEQFNTVIEHRNFTINVEPEYSGIGWVAFVPEMYEPGSPCYAHSMKSREDALLQLVENIEEAILSEKI